MANVKLTWNDNSDNETGFKVYRQGGTLDADQFATGLVAATHRVDSTGDTGITAAQFVDTSVAVGDYTYRVSAFNDAGETFCTSPGVVNVTVTA
tara:strand:- start:2437 stop:2718 length:282 start_codon:yes stop_codon:yes gene_type:complete